MVEPAQLNVPMGPELVGAFAAFSGDRSPLHVDPAHGRRSMYGGNVVHGMLPVMFLLRLLPADIRVRRLRGRFLQPMFPGDEAVVAITGSEAADGGHRLMFEVRRGDAVTARGSMDVVAGDPVAVPDGPQGAAAHGLASGLADAADHPFTALAKGTRTGMPWHWAAEQHLALRALVGLPAGDPYTDPGPFAAAAALSTLVGMRMPGRRAVFQEFDITFERPMIAGPAELVAEVSLLSDATRTIVQDLHFRGGEGIVAHGRVTARVAEEPFTVPDMGTLARIGTGFGLEGRVVLITGASRGIGATTAKLFALHGARVVVDHRASAAEADAVVQDIMAHGGQAMAVQADVADPDAVRRMIGEVERAWGPVDVLVNNAAGHFRPVAFMDTEWGQVQADIDIIVRGAFHTAQAVIPGFLKKGGGSIVNLSTIAAEAPPAMQARYVLAKSALNGLTRALAVEFADRNVRVNMVVPSLVETDLTMGHSRVDIARMKAASPMRRLATAQDVAQAIVYLASPRSAFTTGQKLMVTGGLPPFL